MRSSNKHYKAICLTRLRLAARFALINKGCITLPCHDLLQTWVSRQSHPPIWWFETVKILVSLKLVTVWNLRVCYRDVRHAIKTKVAALMSSRSSIWLILETSRDGLLLSWLTHSTVLRPGYELRDELMGMNVTIIGGFEIPIMWLKILMGQPSKSYCKSVASIWEDSFSLLRSPKFCSLKFVFPLFLDYLRSCHDFWTSGRNVVLRILIVTDTLKSNLQLVALRD